MEGFIQTKKNTIILPGVKHEHFFIQVSDIHLATVDEFSTEADRKSTEEISNDMRGAAKYFAEEYKEPYNSEHDAPTWETAGKMFDYLKTQKPELFLFSGDIIENNNPACVTYFNNVIKELKSDYLYVPGNHEGSYPKNDLMKFNNNSDGIAVYQGEDFIIAGVDDTEKNISDKQLAELEKIAYGPLPIIMMVHIPIATDYNYNDMKGYGEYFSLNKKTGKNAEKLVNILSDEKSKIYAIICGHTHGYSESEYAPGRTQYVCSQGLVGFVHELTVKGN